MGGTSQFTTSMHMFGKDPVGLSDDELDNKADVKPVASNHDFPLQQA